MNSMMHVYFMRVGSVTVLRQSARAFSKQAAEKGLRFFFWCVPVAWAQSLHLTRSRAEVLTKTSFALLKRIRA